MLLLPLKPQPATVGLAVVSEPSVVVQGHVEVSCRVKGHPKVCSEVVVELFDEPAFIAVPALVYGDVVFRKDVYVGKPQVRRKPGAVLGDELSLKPHAYYTFSDGRIVVVVGVAVGLLTVPVKVSHLVFIDLPIFQDMLIAKNLRCFNRLPLAHGQTRDAYSSTFTLSYLQVCKF